MIKRVYIGAVVMGLLCGGRLAEGARDGQAEFSVVESLEIARVPAAFPVRFCLLTDGKRQYAAYYDQERRMTVAARELDSRDWQYQVLPSKIGWDSHNYVTMAVDRDGHLHVSGNMHCVPLVYFRTERAGDIRTLTKLAMTGELEKRVTYPKFLKDHEGNLVFTYRDGGSGNGSNIYNRYDADSRTWTRLLDTPLFNGQGRRNAYPLGPVRGPEGKFHVVWVWRDTPDCATNHHISYARSADLVRWESAGGSDVVLPIVLGMESLWVDPVPSGGGIINGGQRLFFDAEQRPTIFYHKADAKGHMQVYVTRFEDGAWVRRVLTAWEKRVHFSGGGSMPFIGIRIGSPELAEPGVITLTYHHRDYGHGQLVIDEKTLQPMDRKIARRRELPPELGRVESDFPGMSVRRASDLGDPREEGVRYLLQWESLGTNHDRPRKPPLPEPGPLRLIKLRAN